MTKKLLHKFFGAFINHKLRKFELVPHNLFIYLISIVSRIPERQVPAHELVHHNAQRPQVNHVVITFAKDYIGSHIMRCPDDCVCFAYDFTLLLDLLRHCHIDQLEISIQVNHKVLWFDISCDNRFFKQIL